MSPMRFKIGRVSHELHPKVGEVAVGLPKVNPLNVPSEARWSKAQPTGGEGTPFPEAIRRAASVQVMVNMTIYQAQRGMGSRDLEYAIARSCEVLRRNFDRTAEEAYLADLANKGFLRPI